MSLTRKKLADVFEAIADYVEDIEGQKLAAEQAERAVRIDKIAQSYERSTGERLPDEVKKKLAASLDQDVLDHITKAAKDTSESPDSLGSPAEFSDNPVPRTVKEAAHRAEERFLDWICS